MLTAYHIFFEKSTDLECKTIDIIAFAGYLNIFRIVLSRKLPLQCVGYARTCLSKNETQPHYPQVQQFYSRVTWQVCQNGGFLQADLRSKAD